MAACAVALGLAACGGQGAEAPAGASAAGSAPARPATTVSVFAVHKRDVPVTVEAAGTVVALDTVDVRPQLSGTIAEVLVRDGEFVRRGQPLFRLDHRAERANLDKARAQLLRDQATLGDLERQWKRAQELRDQNFIAQSAADTTRANFESQKAAVAASLAAVRAADVGVGFGTISAPLSGRAGAVNVHRGALVQPGGAVLVNINQIDPIGVNFNVPEGQLAALLKAAGGAARDDGAEVSVLVPGAADSGRAAATPQRGKVVFVDNAVDTTTGSIRVKAALPNAQQQFWPGQYVTVRMTTRTMAGALVIPQAALIIRGNERSVYVVKADESVEMRPVQTRMPAGEMVVVEGLQAGDKVVVDGKQNLRPGSKVRATPYQAAGGEARGAGRPGRGASGAQGASAPGATVAPPAAATGGTSP
ncbi:efflux RND transporter periplasmic adaptor subunit [Aquincola sp. S2]|uniref:Efflux RND transporter periplasmic adaptor subunit n=1 Tax=Pseudaquabacterium terrae TaxID=2732868 RepID=A0ABX2EI81_9BURK|nr:efflux RND transporter periplasmic adaptor subunit [Aquabacterium terrae]NRF68318.1 efflux RND transporter periplasmic adaptor subunit [Aquabacterium terrae]